MRRWVGVLMLAAALSVLGAAERPKALVVMLDGTRSDAFITSGFTPLLEGERILGDRYHAAVALYTETVPGAAANSAPNHTGLATGVAPAKSRVFNNGQTAGGNYGEHPHILSYLADGHKTAFLYGWAESGQIRSSTPKVEYLNVGDAGVRDAAVQRIRQDVDALYVYIDAPDEAGHGHGFYPKSKEYLQALDFAGGVVADLLKEIRKRPAFPEEDWLVLVMGDHGGYQFSHGQPSNHARVPHLSVLGRHYDRGFLEDHLSLLDVPATVMHHFGLNPKAYGLDGRVIASHVVPFSGKLPQDLPFLACPQEGAALPFSVDLDCGKGFSIYLQVNAGETQKADPPLFGNKDWGSGRNPGFVLAANYSGGGTGPGYLLNVGLDRPPYRLDLGSFLPVPGKEVGLMVSFFPGDKCYFMEYRGPGKGDCHLLAGDLRNGVLKTNMKLQFGEDGTGEYFKGYQSKFNGTMRNGRILQRPLYPDQMLEFCRRYYQANP